MDIAKIKIIESRVVFHGQNLAPMVKKFFSRGQGLPTFKKFKIDGFCPDRPVNIHIFYVSDSRKFLQKKSKIPYIP